jgi:hypothetical protein
MMVKAQIAEMIGRRLAHFATGNNMPDMSGDDRNRMFKGQRDRYDKACLELADEILKGIYPNPVQFANARGSTFEDMRKAVFEDGLGELGDAILIWVNQGQFIHFEMNGWASPLGDVRQPEDGAK